MADSKITDLTDAGTLQNSDQFVIARGGSDYKKRLLGYPELVYRYTVTGSDKASIDTGVDTADAGTNDWTNGDLLEILMLLRTDLATALDSALVTLNNDGGSNYDRSVINVTNTTVTGVLTTAAAAWSVYAHGSGGTASYASAVSIIIPDFAGTTFFKTATTTSARLDATAASNSMLTGELGYRSTSAITRLAVTANAGQKLKIGSQLLIYKRIAA